MRDETDDPFEIAVEHVAWAISRGMSPYDVFAALAIPAPYGAKWRDAMWAIARAQDELPTGKAMPRRRPAAIMSVTSTKWPETGTPLFN